MTSTFADTLRLLGPNLPPALISPDTLAKIGAIAQHLPGAATKFFGFECLLGENTPRTDFLLRVAANEIGVSILAGDNARATLAPEMQTNAVWRRIGAFCRQWAEPTSVLHGQVNNIWLEFDVENLLLGETPLPSCFFGPSEGHQHTAQNFKDSTINAALRLLQNDNLAAPVESKLGDCLTRLPEGVSVFQVGVMLARPTAAIRLCIHDLAPAQIPAYLVSLGWPGPTAEVATLLTTLSCFVDDIILDVDVGQTLLPKIGLECYFNDYKQPRQEPRWALFLANLVETGLCRPAKRDGLLTYPGYVREQNNQAAWPDHLRMATTMLGGQYDGLFVMGLHHIKIVYQPGQPVQAKAYLYVAQGWVSLAYIKHVQENN